MCAFSQKSATRTATAVHLLRSGSAADYVRSITCEIESARFHRLIISARANIPQTSINKTKRRNTSLPKDFTPQESLRKLRNGFASSETNRACHCERPKRERFYNAVLFHTQPAGEKAPRGKHAAAVVLDRGVAIISSTKCIPRYVPDNGHFVCIS